MLSAFDIFKIGIGPSSSHTVGPMRAALLFARSLEQRGLLARVARLRVDLFGSLGATGHGHATDQGVILGLFGDAPDTVRPETVQPRLEALRRMAVLSWHRGFAVPVSEVKAFVAAGFSHAQYETMLASISAGRSRVGARQA